MPNAGRDKERPSPATVVEMTVSSQTGRSGSTWNADRSTALRRAGVVGPILLVTSLSRPTCRSWERGPYRLSPLPQEGVYRGPGAGQGKEGVRTWPTGRARRRLPLSLPLPLPPPPRVPGSLRSPLPPTATGLRVVKTSTCCSSKNTNARRVARCTWTKEGRSRLGCRECHASPSPGLKPASGLPQ